MLLGKALLWIALLVGGASLYWLFANEIVRGRAVVVDADTLDIGGTRVRLFGVDALEAEQGCIFNGRQWPCGRWATSALVSYLQGSTIICRPAGSDAAVPRRARCYRGSDDVGSFLVRGGWALADATVSLEYQADEARARQSLRGMWSSVFTAPWRYRNEVGSAPR